MDTQFSVNTAAERSVQKEPAWCGFISRPQDGSQHRSSDPQDAGLINSLRQFEGIFFKGWGGGCVLPGMRYAK